MDLAVLPSHREGIPRALLEAAAMGVPIAATDIRGCREVIVPEESGVLFPLKEVDGFAAAVRRLLLDQGLRRRLGLAGRLRVLAHYTEARTAERIITCYERFIEERR
jgi:glycosyltransferase involved in cell wall biosynthesis